jgi:hypothetical protein
MTDAVPADRDRMLVFVISRAIAIHRGDIEPMLADKRLAARLLTEPGSPLERFEARQFEANGDGGFDAQAMIG